MEQKLKKKAKIDLGLVLRARCPSCKIGPIIQGIFTVRKKCPNCSYNFYPEPGFYLGAMMVGYLLTAALTIPPMIILKLMDADMNLIIAWPFLEFLFVGSFLIFYSRIFWLHLEYKMTDRLDGHE